MRLPNVKFSIVWTRWFWFNIALVNLIALSNGLYRTNAHIEALMLWIAVGLFVYATGKYGHHDFSIDRHWVDRSDRSHTNWVQRLRKPIMRFVRVKSISTRQNAPAV